MNKTYLLALAAVFISSGAVASAAAAPMKRLQPAPATSSEKMAPVTDSDEAAPLTSSECRELGGRVGEIPFCKSGNACLTRDQNGDRHAVCLEAKK